MHPQRNHLLFAFLVWLSSFVHAQAQTPTVSLTVSNALSCSQLSATLTAATSCTGGVSYRFTGPNDFVLETTSPVVSVTVDGEYTVVASNTATGCTATRSTTITSTLHPDYLPLVDLYRSTNGPNWTNNSGWLSNCEPCSGWSGVSCTNNRVTDIWLQNNLLNGSIPNSFGKITHLQNLLFSENQLRGKIPHSIYSLKNLYTLGLQRNQLSDTISRDIELMSSLGNLRLEMNQLSGSLPDGLGKLSNLNQIIISGNLLDMMKLESKKKAGNL